MRYEEAIKILNSLNLEGHPSYAEAYKLIKYYAFSYYMLTCDKKSNLYTPTNSLGGLLGYEKEK